MTSRPAISVAEIVALLTADAVRVTRECLPGAHFTASRATCGSLAGEDGQSLSVYFKGHKPGNWRDFSSGEAGDVLDLVAQCLCDGDKPKAVQWAKAWLGIDGADLSKIQVKRREAEKRRREAEKRAARLDARYRQLAWKVWGVEAEKDIAGTPVEHYLRGRGIEPGQCPSTGALRHNPEVLYTQDGDPASGTFYDAMVAAIVSPAGKFLGVHRTYLEPDAGDAWHKADVLNPKKCLGAFQGGYISISKGATAQTMANAPQGSRCIVVEGIEDALTLAMAMPGERIVAGISLDNIPQIEFPAAIGEVIFFRDNDVKPAAVAAFKRAVAAMSGRHYTLKVAHIGGAKDANGFLMEQGGHAA